MSRLFKRVPFVLFFTLISLTVLGQKGIIRGTIIEDQSAEPLFSVAVVIKGTTVGAITDFDGNFEINVEPGTYELQASFVSYETITISNVEVLAGEVTFIDGVRMLEDVEELEAVVVSAEVIKTSEAALLTVKRKSANLIDGISSSSFRKIGDSDAASAARRITGVSIEGGRYVYVRGLGDRYTKTLINQMDVPGLDPDRNTLQMDIFPTSILDNIIVSKSFTADLPADFTGGMVNIETKDFPEIRTMNISAGIGYNPAMHFNDRFLTGGSTNFLGFDDGTRDIPVSDEEITNPGTGGIIDPRTVSPTSTEGMLYSRQIGSFDKNLTSLRQSSTMDYNIGFSAGDQLSIGHHKLGYNFAITYRNSTEYFENAEYGRYGIPSDQGISGLERREFQKGDYGTSNALLGGLAGLAYKTRNSKYKFNILRLTNGETRAGIFNFTGSDEGSDFSSFQHNLEYSERTLTNVFLGGQHFSEDGNWQIEWKISPTRSTIDDPDIKFTRYEIRNEGDLSITTEGGFPERIWRDLNEDNLSGTMGITRKYQFNGWDGKLKVGVSNTYKDREYSIRRFQIFVDPDITLTGNPNELLAPENVWPMEGSQFDGNYFVPDFLPVNPNFYQSTVNNTAFFISNEFSPFENVKAIVGVRTEDYEQQYTGVNQRGQASEDTTVIDEFNFFPTANLIFSPDDNKNLRLSYYRTIARFSFREASFAEIFDPLTGRTFIGALNPGFNDKGEEIWDGNIRSTLIDNFDIRWETFYGHGQTISVGAFYKHFHNAIEMVQSATADNNFQPRNVGDARVLGGEFEFRQRLGTFFSGLDHFTLIGNLTLLKSRIEMNPEEFASRQRNAREGQKTSKARILQGQAPFLINGGVSYAGPGNGLEVGLYYNVQGETLVFTGIADRPDIYSVPFHSLNFSLNKTMGADGRLRLGIKASNILGNKKEQLYKSPGSLPTDLFQRLDPGTRLSFSIRYSIF